MHEMVPSRDLRNRTRAVLERVRAGETLTVTVEGQAIATLEPVTRRAPWTPRATLLRLLESSRADPGLADELRTLAPETTDDLPQP